MRLTLRELIAYALLGALLIVVQVALAALPNIELVSVLLVAYTLTLGVRALFPLYIFVIAEGLLYGFSMWFINYLYVWAVLVLLILLFRRRTQSIYFFAAISALYGLFFGALCAVPYFFAGGAAGALAYWVSGIPFDLLHCAGNALTALLLLKPIWRLLERSLAKYL